MSLALYRTNNSRVVGEVIDGEAIIIDMQLGTYFSLPDTAAFVWGLLSEEVSLTDMVEAVQSHYRCDQLPLESMLADFLRQLEQEGLIVVCQDQSGARNVPALGATQAAEGRPRFAPLVLNRYDDMKDFLLVDPIHEVQDAGWPVRKSEP